MANVKKSDYENIANIFNKSGDKAAQEYIVNTYGTKAPRGVIARIKKSPDFKYDDMNKKIIKTDSTEEKIFMDIDELCNNKDSNINQLAYPNTNDSSTNKIELLYIDLMQEKLIDIMKYVKLDHCTRTISINKSALNSDGYKINFIQEISGHFQMKLNYPGGQI